MATGAREYKPKEFLYGETDRIMTQLELGKLVSNNARRGFEVEPGDHDPVRRLPQ